jgi:hypothetical protein
MNKDMIIILLSLTLIITIASLVDYMFELEDCYKEYD